MLLFMPVISCQFDGFNELILPSGLTVFKVFTEVIIYGNLINIWRKNHTAA